MSVSQSGGCGLCASTPVKKKGVGMAFVLVSHSKGGVGVASVAVSMDICQSKGGVMIARLLYLSISLKEFLVSVCVSHRRRYGLSMSQ